MAVRLIIFDLDGTLIDSAGDISAAVNYAIGPYGLPPVTLEETKACIGEGVSILIEKLLALKEATSLDREKLTKRVLEYYSLHLVANTVPYPEVRETLDHLSACRKAVISNKLTGLAEKTLEALGLLKYFELVAGSDSSPERKPSPVPILRVLSLLDVAPREALIVGDSVYDMAARTRGRPQDRGCDVRLRHAGFFRRLRFCHRQVFTAARPSAEPWNVLKLGRPLAPFSPLSGALGLTRWTFHLARCFLRPPASVRFGRSRVPG